MVEAPHGTAQGSHPIVPGALVWAASAAQDISHPGAGAYAVGVGGGDTRSGQHGDDGLNQNPMS